MPLAVPDLVKSTRRSPTVVLAALVAAGWALPAAAASDPSWSRGRAVAVQVRLAQHGFSCGEIDGKWGKSSERALAAFKQSRGGRPTGRLDEATAAALGDAPVLTDYRITAEDVEGPFAAEIPDDMMEKAELPALAYTSPVEALAERFHASPDLLRALNPRARFEAGETLRVPAVHASAGSQVEPAALRSASAAGVPRATPDGGAKGARLVVSAGASALMVVGAGDEILHYAPVTAGSGHDPLPIGEWKVTAIERDPPFRYNPDLFWDADESHAKALIQPGPNNPVGAVWIDLSKEHYGIHGTSEPSQIGYETSHGCVRLTNWDALRVASLIAPGTRVSFRE